MKDLRNVLNEIKALTARVQWSSENLTSLAAQGLAPDAGALGEIARVGDEMLKARAKIGEMLAYKLGDAGDYSALPLAELELNVAKCEARARLSAQAYARIIRACDALKRLGAPECAGQSLDDAISAARAALAAGECASAEFEARTMPYLDIYALLTAGDEAPDAALLGRVAQAYPQIAWFARSRARLNSGDAEFDELTDDVIAGLKRAESDGDAPIRALDAATSAAPAAKKRPIAPICPARKASARNAARAAARKPSAARNSAASNSCSARNAARKSQNSQMALTGAEHAPLPAQAGAAPSDAQRASAARRRAKSRKPPAADGDDCQGRLAEIREISAAREAPVSIGIFSGGNLQGLKSPLAGAAASAPVSRATFSGISGEPESLAACAGLAARARAECAAMRAQMCAAEIRVWRELFAPESGPVALALCAIIARTPAPECAANAFWEGIFIRGAENVVCLEGLRRALDAICSRLGLARLTSAQLIKWLAWLRPALRAIGGWRALYGI